MVHRERSAAIQSSVDAEIVRRVAIAFAMHDRVLRDASLVPLPREAVGRDEQIVLATRLSARAMQATKAFASPKNEGRRSAGRRNVLEPRLRTRQRALALSPLASRRSTAALTEVIILGSTPGRASWNYRVQTGGPSPAPVQRAPRGPVIVPAGRCPKPPECGVTKPARGDRSRCRHQDRHRYRRPSRARLAAT